MKLKQCFNTCGLILLSFISAPTVSFSQEPTDIRPNRITFFCRVTTDPVTGREHPTTIASIPNRKASVKFIFWESEYFTASGWTRQKRCEIVSQKFQAALDSGRYYLVFTKIGSFPTICAVDSTDKVCDTTSQLFQLARGSDPETILQRIVGIQNGLTSVPIFQSSGLTKYYNIYKLLERSPNLIND